jgi:hypothetical protein
MRIASALIVCLLLQTPSQADIDKAKQQILAIIDGLFAPATAVIRSNLQAALDAAPVGATLWLAGTIKEPLPITIRKSVTLRGGDFTPPKLDGGLVIAADQIDRMDVRRLQDQGDVIVPLGHPDDVTLVNVNVIPRPDGQKRGILGNMSHLTLRGVKAEGFWLPDQDAQAFACWDGCSDVLVDGGSRFSGAGETFLVGGANETAQSGQPRNIIIRDSILTKDLAWRKPGVQVKTTLELKNVIGCLIENNVIENSWQSAQDGYLITITPRNQDGRAPWTQVADVIIRNNNGGNAAGFLNGAGLDTDKDPRTGLPYVSQLTRNIQVVNNTMTGFDPSVWRIGTQWGTNKLIQWVKGGDRLTISGNMLAGAHYYLTPSGNSVEGSALYLDERSQLFTNFTFTNNTFPKTTYLIMGGNSSPDSAWNDYVASGTQSGNVAK